MEKHGICTVSQLFAHVMFGRAPQSVAMTDTFYERLAELGINGINRGHVVEAVATKVNTWVPGVYDPVLPTTG